MLYHIFCMWSCHRSIDESSWTSNSVFQSVFTLLSGLWFCNPYVGALMSVVLTLKYKCSRG
jgi:hypothetical protein